MFEIKIKPKTFQCQGMWSSKAEGVVFVEKEEHIEPMWDMLCEQDDYWESYKNLIKVAPKEIDSESDLVSFCEYCGKTDIYEVDKLRAKALEKGIEFKLYQTFDCHDY